MAAEETAFTVDPFASFVRPLLGFAFRPMVLVTIPTLDHYTASAVAVRDIVASGHLHATNVAFLNDRSEIAYAVDLIESVFREKQRSGSAQLGRLISAAHRQMQRDDVLAESFVSCFCERDSLTHWQTYGGSGVGYALRFDASSLSDVRSQSARLMRVQYSLREQRHHLNRVIEFADLLLTDALLHRHHFKVTSKALVELTGDALRRSLNFILPALKDSRFRMEREWRIVITARPGQSRKLIDFNAVEARLTPFVKVQIRGRADDPSSLPLRQIRILDGADSELRKCALSLLLREHGLQDVVLSVSAIPLRAP